MAEVITSGKVIQKPELVLEIDDFLPPGLIGVRTKTRDETGFGQDRGDNSTGTLVDEETENEEDEDTGGGTGDWLYDTLPVPTTMRIISQTVRVGADKKMVVDVVIETDDFPGINEFEARLVLDAPVSEGGGVVNL